MVSHLSKCSRFPSALAHLAELKKKHQWKDSKYTILYVLQGISLGTNVSFPQRVDIIALWATIHSNLNFQPHFLIVQSRSLAITSLNCTYASVDHSIKAAAVIA